ncbi:four helix bundle protein [Candidatus Falkowbacteria bacterium]|nr:four helix bundle protein [Candidatus Falkowbacteria bacterium]
MPKSYSYQDLLYWQRSMDLVIAIYELTNEFPKSEIYGLASQMKRASISIPSNIAGGRRRGSRKEYHKFLIIAYASGAELETQIEIAKRLPLGQGLNFNQVDNLLNEVMRMLNKTLATLRT